MNVNHFVTNVNTNQLDTMIEFYRDILGLEVRPEFGPGAFVAGSPDFIALIIEEHGDIVGPAKEPARAILNFLVDDARAEQERLKAAGVTFARDASEDDGFVVATFLDPDGNLCQLMQMTG
jgi:catechol 2,3-dioxygenase-like lactoylglutathione lyase family enzyme